MRLLLLPHTVELLRDRPVLNECALLEHLRTRFDVHFVVVAFCKLRPEPVLSELPNGVSLVYAEPEIEGATPCVFRGLFPLSINSGLGPGLHVDAEFEEGNQ